jgi:hypothetical protein
MGHHALALSLTRSFTLPHSHFHTFHFFNLSLRRSFTAAPPLPAP